MKTKQENVADVLEGWLRDLKMGTQTELAHFLEVKPAAITAAKARGVLPKNWVRKIAQYRLESGSEEKLHLEGVIQGLKIALDKAHQEIIRLSREGAFAEFQKKTSPQESGGQATESFSAG